METVGRLENPTASCWANCSSPLGRQAVVDVPAKIELNNQDIDQASPIITADRERLGFVAALAAGSRGRSMEADQRRPAAESGTSQRAPGLIRTWAAPNQPQGRGLDPVDDRANASESSDLPAVLFVRISIGAPMSVVLRPGPRGKSSHSFVPGRDHPLGWE